MKWTDFVKKYQNYNKNRFYKGMLGDVRFLFNGDEYDPFPDGKLREFYEFPVWNGHHYPKENIHDYLGEPVKASNFPKSVLLTNKTIPIPAVVDNPKDIKSLLSPLPIRVTPNKGFNMKTNVFELTPPSTYTSEGYSRWLEKPNIKYWSQQLNFAVWCATSGCGIGYDLIEGKDQISCILRFHVLFTIRRILYDLNVPMPWDNNFTPYGSKYNKTSFTRICNEFGIKNNADFRFKQTSTRSDMFHFTFTSANESMTGTYTSTHKDRSQYNYFVVQKGLGITKAGMSRLNQSIEGFVYCVLGSQVNTRSSILGSTGSAEETQDVFMSLFKEAIIEKDISKSIQRYQFAVMKAKVKLDLAISPGCWLLPSSLVINTGSVIGYNNKLQRATKEMRFGINNINTEVFSKPAILPAKHEKQTEEIKPVKKEKPKPVIVKQVLPKEDHHYQKVGVIVATGAMGYYLLS